MYDKQITYTLESLTLEAVWRYVLTTHIDTKLDLKL